MNLMELALRFTHAAAHVLWVGALVALAVFAIERLFTRAAAGRHALHLCGLLLTALVLPVAFLSAPVKVGQSRPRAPETFVLPVATPVPANAEPAVMAGVRAPVEQMGNRKVGGHMTAMVPAVADEPGADWERIAPWVTGAYLAGLLGMIVRLACGFVGSTRMRRRSQPVKTSAWTEALRRMGDRIKVRVRPALRWSREVAAPVIVGFVKPAILLPVALASRLSPAQVEAVLAHELAHLRRRDTWALAVQRLVETVLFFHPAVWWMSHRMEAAREEACDDLVLAAGCDPADYAEALVICSECRSERSDESVKLAERLAATGSGGTSLRRRVLRLLGGGDDGTVRLGRTGWVLGLLLVGGVAMVLAAGNGERVDLADFDFGNPPSGYEKDVKVADRNQCFKVDGLQFQASPLRWENEGWLRLPKHEQGPGKELFLNLGTSDGYEVVEIRLFDHATRQLIHDNASQSPGEQSRNFLVERIGPESWLRVKETGGTLPDRIDVWLRIATSASGKTLVLKAEDGASAKLGGSEIVVTSLLEGAMNGKGSGPDGKMIWDLSSAHSKDFMTTVNLENRGDVPRGRYHLVAVTRDRVRHPMDHAHFWDFGNMNRHAHFLMDVALKDLDHLELVPFKDRHKFFFNGLEVPRKENTAITNFDATVAIGVVRSIRSQRLPFVTEERLRQIGDEIAALVRMHQRDDLSAERKQALLTALINPQHLPLSHADTRALNNTYLEFPDRIKTLEWKIFMAITRAPLSDADQRRLTDQREWMRSAIAGLSDERHLSRKDVLADLEVRFADPLCTPFDRPMTDGQFARFQEEIATYVPEAQTGVNENTPTRSRTIKPHNPLPSIIHQFVWEALGAQYLGEKHDYLVPLFDNDRVGGLGAVNGYVTLHFMSNRQFLADTRALDGMEESFSVVDALTNECVSAPPDQCDPANFAGWLEKQDKGDFGLNGEGGGSLVAVRGARLALLDVKNWIQADAIQNDALRATIERQNKKQIELAGFFRAQREALEQGKDDDTGPYFGILTKEGRLAVVHLENFTGLEDISYRLRVRENNGTDPNAEGTFNHLEIKPLQAARQSEDILGAAGLALP